MWLFWKLPLHEWSSPFSHASTTYNSSLLSSATPTVNIITLVTAVSCSVSFYLTIVLAFQRPSPYQFVFFSVTLGIVQLYLVCHIIWKYKPQGFFPYFDIAIKFILSIKYFWISFLTFCYLLTLGCGLLGPGCFLSPAKSRLGLKKKK